MRIKKLKKNSTAGLLQYVPSKAYRLTDFKEFAFSGNRRLVQTGGKKQELPNVSTNKLHLPAGVCRESGKTVRSLEEVCAMVQKKQCEDFTKASH
jgi:hypothetical protein